MKPNTRAEVMRSSTEHGTHATIQAVASDADRETDHDAG